MKTNELKISENVMMIFPITEGYYKEHFEIQGEEGSEIPYLVFIIDGNKTVDFSEEEAYSIFDILKQFHNRHKKSPIERAVNYFLLPD